MYLHSLYLKNFRNYPDLTVDFDPRFNFIFGKNAQGKTNLLEAVFYLANLKSFRTSKLVDLVTDQTQSSLIESRLMQDSDQNIYHDIKIKIEDGKKDIWLNNKN